ncbi:TonB-dependent receptor plug domain-containing protein [Dyadobacter sp. CY326]|uniref:TonB-dependent receptor plug domain-containing protein n=1 Tax=Dyadobacter sp. CY326 TaxID=2907300 RepID=UPI001F2648C3|nr:TonB-dependent receptor plug domain-containing protein [Dyadobacter sp. CY326]MCE7068640.1 TonB-dependent receptor plug domain-containing protein [Dyadobacter sp. CY326]
MPWIKEIFRKCLIPIILLFITAFNWVDEDFTQHIAAKLANYRRLFPQEKAYLHLDKPYYVTGDTLWFKSYLVEGALHMPDSASQMLYVDLIEQRTGRNVALRRVQLLGGIGNGEIVLADSIQQGAYTIRAYTNWMRNFSDEQFFQKDIYLFDPESVAPPVSSNKLDLKFFPEGGQMVAGINTRIAFKAVNESGLGQDVRGFVLNKANDTVASFKSAHLGMGRFQFEPQSGELYTAYLHGKNGKALRYDFPKMMESGFTMIVDNLSNAQKMRVLAYCKIPGKQESLVHIVGHSKGIVAFVAKGKITSKGLMMSLPTTELPDGITHLTLFNDENKPVCERLVFVNHNRSLQVKITPSKTAYKPREKASVEIAVLDSAGKPVETNLSVSVTDAGQILQQAYDENITSSLLLSSDLKGFIEQPAYYFDPEKSERKIHTDLLMMTQGWSRFRWEDVLADSLPGPQHFVEQGVTLEGEVRKGKKKLTDKIALSMYVSNDSLGTFMTAETNEAGRFAVYNLVFTDSLKIRLQGMNKKGNANLSFILDPFLTPKVTLVKAPFYPITVDAQQLQAYLKRAEQDQEIARKIRESRERLLQEVTIKGKKEVQRDSRKLYGSADASIKVTSQMASAGRSILDILAGRVAGVQVVGSGMNASVYIRGNRGEPLFVLDGMPVDKDMIASLNTFDVESIDVLKGASAAIFGSRGGNGVISILTKRGNENYDYSQDVVPGVLVTKIAGFNAPKEFYAPTYEVTRPQGTNPDYRATVFWAPMLRTDKQGKAKLEYYNSDATTTIDIRADVLSLSGTPGFGKAGYAVQ